MCVQIIWVLLLKVHLEKKMLIWDGVLPYFCVRQPVSERGKAGHISGKIMLCEVQSF